MECYSVVIIIVVLHERNLPLESHTAHTHIHTLHRVHTHTHAHTPHIHCLGHFVFELSCGYELDTVVPGKEDWSRVTDSALLDVLQFVFHTDQEGRFTSTIQTVRGR